jgi:uncharacterized protein YidB (DUF937 family)
MGLLDNLTSGLKDALKQGETAAIPAIVSAALSKTDLGGLQGVITTLQQGGLNDQVRSWLGNGTNLPVTPDQLKTALGNEKVQQLARQFGLPVDQVLKLMAEHLPAAVDQASPNGTLQS